MRAHRTPIVGAKTWTFVMNRAGRRCQCNGACGSKHNPNGINGREQRRCDRTADMDELTVAPGDLTLSAIQAARVPVPDLRAWCSGCHAKTAAKQRAARRKQQATMDAAAPALFDL